MKFTTLQTNMVILAIVLAILQGFILWLMNGDLPEIIRDKDLAVLATIFSPTAGIVWCLKQTASYKPNSKYIDKSNGKITQCEEKDDH